MRNSKGQFVKGCKRPDMTGDNNHMRSPEHRKRMSILFKGKKHSLEVRKKMSELRKGKRTRSDNPMWKGGICKTVNGYIKILIPEHPYASFGYVVEHRLVMEKNIGRYLLPNEIVHHINHIKDDNRIENLQLMEKLDHDLFHIKEKWKTCKGYTYDKSRKKWYVSSRKINGKRKYIGRFTNENDAKLAWENYKLTQKI